MFFNRGAAGKKLDYFLSFFQVCLPECSFNHLPATKISKYYIFTKASLPMDIEFLVQDTFALTRPQWKLASGLDEAVKAFQLAVAQDQKSAGVDKGVDVDDATSDASSDDDNADNDEDGDDNDDSASEEEEAEVSLTERQSLGTY